MKIKSALIVLPISVLLISAGIDLANLENYAAQAKPFYITKDNTGSDAINNKSATLGRVLFYDKKLSAANTIACGSCHKQEFAFGDTARLSKGITGAFTTRHVMRLVNARFAQETKFFWDERAASLEDQTTRPIRAHDEMGYSGLNGDQDINALLTKLSQIYYYKNLFAFAYGDSAITESRIQKSLAQFIRSIQSFDSKFDAGLSQSGNMNAPFANFTTLENQGKNLFLTPPNQGGAGCQGCHRAPEFDIDPASKNNGVIAAASGNTIDITNTRAPSLRDVFNINGVLNGPLMHNGNFVSIDQVIDHYNLVAPDPANTNLDPRLAGPGGHLQLSNTQKNALKAFIKTLSGTNLYTDPKWSDPFDQQGNLLGSTTGIISYQAPVFTLYPSPAADYLQINIRPGNYSIVIYNLQGRELLTADFQNTMTVSLNEIEEGILLVKISDHATSLSAIKKIIHL